MDLINLEDLNVSDKDPEFYESKAQLRSALPEASMIEIAEGEVTIVMGNLTAVIRS